MSMLLPLRRPDRRVERLRAPRRPWFGSGARRPAAPVQRPKASEAPAAAAPAEGEAEPRWPGQWRFLRYL